MTTPAACSFLMLICNSLLIAKSSRVESHAFCIVQRAMAQSKTGYFRGYGVAEAPLIFQAGWSACMYSLIFCSFHFLIWNFRVCFCTYDGTVNMAINRLRTMFYTFIFFHVIRDIIDFILHFIVPVEMHYW
jgi:hypothetical protein